MIVEVVSWIYFVLSLNALSWRRCVDTSFADTSYIGFSACPIPSFSNVFF